MDYEALGKRIRAERKARGWTQMRLATAVHLSTSFLGHIERGTRKASLETVVSIANVLKVHLESLLIESLTLPDLPPRPDVDYNIQRTRRVKVLRQIVRQFTKELDEWVES